MRGAAVRHWPMWHAICLACHCRAWHLPGMALPVAGTPPWPGMPPMARARAREGRRSGDRARREPAWLAWVRASRLAEPLLPGRHLARPAKQLTVVVFLDVYRSA